MKEKFICDCMKQFEKCYLPLKDNKIILFGASARGKMMVQALEDIGMKSNILAICDNDTSKWGDCIESIEMGTELEALQGAESLIKRWKPKLAICIYHKREDPIVIPEYLHKIVPAYKLKIRHYTYSQHETVLYAYI